jgi:Zn-dependent protease/CBS domain-containing protein
MRNGISLGRIFGINIIVDWSWIFIFLLVTWNLAAGVFPQVHPEWTTSLDIGIALVASVLFFLSVLAHELAHSLVAVAHGLPVRSITLFLFGGVSNIQREPQSPGTEFTMAIVGPLTSIVIGIVAVVLGLIIDGASLIQSISRPLSLLAGMNPISTLLLWLGPINIILGVFNMIPGFPLDGGRVLRSILWGITDNLRIATRWATWIGQAIAWIFIVAGISMFFGVSIPFLGTGVISGVWLAFIGWFLNQAAVQSYRQVVVEDMLEGIPVARFMRSNLPSVPAQMTISQLIDDQIMNSDERSFPVMDGDQLIGVVGMDDLRKAPRSEWDHTPVSKIMTPRVDLDTVTPREDVTEALEAFSRKDLRQLPVVQDGRVVGMIRQSDIMRWLQLHSQAPLNSR